MQELQVVLREFASLLQRHKVSDAALKDFLELAERMMQRPPHERAALTAIAGGSDRR